MNQILFSISSVSGIAHDRPARFDPRQIDEIYGSDMIRTRSNWLGAWISRGPLPGNRALAIGLLGIGR